MQHAYGRNFGFSGEASHISRALDPVHASHMTAIALLYFALMAAGYALSFKVR